MEHMAGPPHNFVAPPEDEQGGEEVLEEEEEEEGEEERSCGRSSSAEVKREEADSPEVEEEEKENNEEKPRLRAVVEGGEIKLRPEPSSPEEPIDVKKEPQGSGKIMCPVLTCNRLLTTKTRLVQHLRVGKHNQPCPSCGKAFPRVRSLLT